MFNLGSVVVDYEANTKAFEDGVKSVNKTIDTTGSKSQSTSKKIGAIGTVGQRSFGMAAGAAGAGMLLGVLANITAEAKAFNDQVEVASNKAQAQLGLTAEQAEAAGDIIQDVYVANYGQSLQEVQGHYVALRQSLGDWAQLSDQEFKTATENSIKIADAYEEAPERISGATSTLMKNFNLDITEAQSLLAQGFQSGLDQSGDYLDTIMEYSTQFKENGASADEFFNVIKTGQAQGLLGTDKAGDLIKEFGLRIREDSKANREALEMLGIDADAMFNGLSSGSIRGIDAFAQVQTAIKGMDDENKAFMAGAQLMGTPFEDLGADAVANIDIVNNALSENTGALEGLDQQYADSANSQEQFNRTLEATKADALEPVTDAINQAQMAFFEFAMPLAENKALVIGVVSVIGLLALALGLLSLTMAVTLIPTMWATAVAGWAMMAPFLPIVGIFLGIIAVIGLLWWAFSSNFLGIRDIVDNVFGWIMNTAVPWVIDAFKSAWDYLVTFGEGIANIFNGVKDAVGQAIKFAANAVVGQFNMAINGANILIRGANLIPGVNISTIPTIPRFAAGTRNFGGGMAMINDGVSNEALRIAGVTYLPQSTDVINGATTNGMQMQQKSSKTIISLKDISSPMIIGWIKSNISEFKKAGIQIA